MESVFIKILNMGITAGWLVLAVVVARFLLKKAPRWISVLLWSFVGIRLVCPLSLESVFSLVPSTSTVPTNIMYMQNPAIQSGVPVLNSVINPALSESFAPEAGASVNPLQVVTFIATIVWIAGVMAMLVYLAVSYFKILRKVREAVLFKDNIYLCDRVSSPFILGIFRPKIYLPSNMEREDYDCVIAHENAHLVRRDHFWKPIGFLLLSVYWFNPLLWLGYVLLCCDIEFACDEKVIKQIGVESKKQYSEALINCSVPRRAITACPLAFGEVGIKGRIKSVLNYKKPTLWIIIAAIVLSTILAVCLLTDPAVKIDKPLTVFIDCNIASAHQSETTDGKFSCLDWEVIGKEKQGSEISVYLWIMYAEFDFADEVVLEKLVHTPAMITVEKEKGEYKLVEYWEPNNEETVGDKFPTHLLDKATNPDEYFSSQLEELEKLASDHFTENPKIPDPYEITKETKFTYSYSTTVVNSRNYEEIVKCGGFYDPNYETIEKRNLPIIKISTKSELDSFITKMSEVVDFGRKMILSDPSFYDMAAKYDDKYFEENTLILILLQIVYGDEFHIEYLDKKDDTLTVGITEVFHSNYPATEQLWVGIDVPKQYNLDDVMTLKASIVTYIMPDGMYIDESNIVKRFVVSSDNLKYPRAVTLFNNGCFTVVYKNGTSFMKFGTNYELSDGMLKLIAVDGNLYVFDVANGEITFNKDLSSEEIPNIDGLTFTEAAPPYPSLYDSDEYKDFK